MCVWRFVCAWCCSRCERDPVCWVQRQGRATRHGSGQECAMWVGSTIEPGSLRVVNGTGVTPLYPPCWVMTTTQRYSCQVLLTTPVNTHILRRHVCICTNWVRGHRHECTKVSCKIFKIAHTKLSCLHASATTCRYTCQHLYFYINIYQKHLWNRSKHIPLICCFLTHWTLAQKRRHFISSAIVMYVLHSHISPHVFTALKCALCSRDWCSKHGWHCDQSSQPWT